MTTKIMIGLVLGLTFIIWGGIILAQTTSQGPRLTKLTANEYIDLNKVSFFRGSYTIDLSSIGGDLNYLVDAFMVADGVRTPLSQDGEKKLKQLLGIGENGTGQNF